MSKPFFSVIVPAHNAEGFIRKTLDSVAMQDFKDYELIVVCDRCTDNTYNVACEYDHLVPTITVIETDYGMDGLARNGRGRLADRIRQGSAGKYHDRTGSNAGGAPADGRGA